MVSFRDLPDESSNPIAAESQLMSTNKSVDKSRLREVERTHRKVRRTQSRLLFLSKVPGLRSALKTVESIAEFKTPAATRLPHCALPHWDADKSV